MWCRARIAQALDACPVAARRGRGPACRRRLGERPPRPARPAPRRGFARPRLGERALRQRAAVRRRARPVRADRGAGHADAARHHGRGVGASSRHARRLALRRLERRASVRVRLVRPVLGARWRAGLLRERPKRIRPVAEARFEPGLGRRLALRGRTYDGRHVRLYPDGAEVGQGTATQLAIGYGLGSQGAFIGTYRGRATSPSPATSTRSRSATVRSAPWRSRPSHGTPPGGPSRPRRHP
jgi:hypothetical protein